MDTFHPGWRKAFVQGPEPRILAHEMARKYTKKAGMNQCFGEGSIARSVDRFL
jgi:hypothetical protein